MISYVIGSKKPYSRFLNIVIEVTQINQSVLDLRLPIWRPGRYIRQNFAAKVRNFRVTNHLSEGLNWTKSGSHIWQINTHKMGSIRVEYEYYSDVMDAGNGCWVDEYKLYINPGTCLMYVKELVSQPAQIVLCTPPDFAVATTFDLLSGQEAGLKLDWQQEFADTNAHYFAAQDYHQIVDTPILASNQMLHLDTEIEGVKFNFWFEGSINLPQEQFLTDVTKIITAEMNLFGNFPQSRFDIIYLFLDKLFAHGVEHYNSTVIAIGPAQEVYKISDNGQKSLIHRYFLTTTAHELFHAWNVKKIIPQEYSDLQYEQEVLSSLHWITEGLTSYYEDKLSWQSGVFNEDEHKAIKAELIQVYLHTMEEVRMSVSMASLESWVDGYSPDKAPFRTPNFYLKGNIIFWIIDLLIQQQTNKQKSLDDVVRYFDSRFDTTKGYSENDIVEAINVASGLDITDRVKHLIHTTEPLLPLLQEQLKIDGVEWQLRKNPDLLQSVLGLKHKNLEITAIYPDSPSHRAGVYLKDKLVSIGGVNLETVTNINYLVASLLPGQKLQVTLLRSNTFIGKTIWLPDTQDPSEVGFYPIVSFV